MTTMAAEEPPHGVVVIVLPDTDGPSSSSFAVRDEAIALLNDRDGGDAERVEQQRATTTSAAVLALAALAVAGYFLLYHAGADANAGRLVLEAAPSSSFLLPLYPKTERNSSTATGRRGNAFLQDRQYYTTVWIGNPARPYFLDVDTGSDLTWIQCDAPCANCAKGPHPLYKPAQGNTMISRSDPSCQDVQGSRPSDTSWRQCDYDIVFADGSSSRGVLARDTVHLDAQDLDVAFGCSYDQQGDHLLASLEHADGVLGLSRAPTSLPSQLAGRGLITSSVFGHCIAADPGDGGAGGYLFLGDAYVPGWGVTWVPVLNGPGNAYSTEAQKLVHGDLQLGGGRGHARKSTRVIFDSGSTYTYFPREAYRELIAALQDASPSLVQDDSDRTLPFCMRADSPVRSVDDVKHLFKPLTLQFKNRLFVFSRTFTVHPEDYLVVSDKGNVCLGVLDGTEVGYGSAVVLGDASLRRKLVLYDNGQNQIGWAPSSCMEPHKEKESIIPFFLRRVLSNLVL